MDDYNNSIHSSTIVQKPVDDTKPIEDKPRVEKKLPELNKGDNVRISNLTKKSYRKVAIFEKSYMPNWSKSIYEIENKIIIPNSEKNINGPQYKYKLKGPNGEKTKLYSRYELLWIPEDTINIKRIKPVYNPKIFNREAHLKTLSKNKKIYKEPDETLLESRKKNPRIIKTINKNATSFK